MPELDAELLSRVVGETLEGAAFLFSDPVESAPLDGADRLGASIRFFGPRAGWLTVESTRALGEQAAANLLALEEGSAEAVEQGPAALAELLNVMVGAVLAAAYGTGKVFELEPPVLGAPRPAGPGDVAAALLVNGQHPLQLRLAFEAPVQPGVAP